MKKKADTLTAGVVFQPTMIEGLTLSVDYYDIEIEDAITEINEEDTLFLCYQDVNFPDNDFFLPADNAGCKQRRGNPD